MQQGEKKNQYLADNLCLLNRVHMVDVRIYEWIACAKHHIPSLSVMDCAKSFQAFHGVSESELSINKIIKTYNRMQKEIFEEMKTVNQFKQGKKI